jgi:hypothetical protein
MTKRSSVFCAVPNVVTKLNEDEMSRTCSTHGTHTKCIHNFSWKTSREYITWKIEVKMSLCLIN